METDSKQPQKLLKSKNVLFPTWRTAAFRLGGQCFYGCVSDLPSESGPGVSLEKTPADKSPWLPANHQRVRWHQSATESANYKVVSARFPGKTNYAAAGGERRRVTAVSDDSRRRNLDGVFPDYSNCIWTQVAVLLKMEVVLLLRAQLKESRGTTERRACGARPRIL